MAVINTVDQEKINVNNNGALRGVTLPAGPRQDVGPIQGGNVDRLIELYPRIQPKVTPQHTSYLPETEASAPPSGYDYLMNAYPSGGNRPYPQSTPWQNQNPYTKPNNNPGVGNGGTTTYPSYSPEDPRNEGTQGSTGTWPSLGGLLGQNGQDYVNGLKDWLGSLRPNNQGGANAGSGGTSFISSLFGNYGTGYSNYLNQMYDEALKAQLAQLQASYEQNISDLEASRLETDRAYTEQMRQAVGTSERDAAAWREMANAYGLNSGAIGQAALAQNNQRQSSLNTLAADQAAAIAELERQRVLLGKQYQQEINAAIAENNFEKANALYQEAVRLDEKTDKLKSSLSGGSGISMVYRSPSGSNLTSSYVTTKDTSKDSSSGSGSGSNLSDDYQDATSKEMTEAEFNEFWRGLKEYVSAGQQDRLDSLIEANADRLTDEQYEKVKEQLAKLKPKLTKPGYTKPGNRLRQELR